MIARMRSTISWRRREGRHNANMEASSKWRRRILGIPVALWLAVAVAGAAVAAWLVLITVTGTVTTANATVMLTGAPTTTAGTCTGTGTNFGTTTNITWSNTVGGSTCTLEYGMKGAMTNTVALRLQRFHSAASGVDANLGSYCGTTIPAASDSGNIVQVTLTINDTAGFGQSMNLAGSSFEWVPAADYVSGNCT